MEINLQVPIHVHDVKAPSYPKFPDLQNITTSFAGCQFSPIYPCGKGIIKINFRMKQRWNDAGWGQPKY